MADYTIESFLGAVDSLKELVAGGANVDAIKSKISELTGSLGEFGGATGALSGIPGMSGAIKELNTAFNGVREGVPGATNNIENFAGKAVLFAPMTSKLFELSRGFVNVGSSASDASENIASVANDVGNLAAKLKLPPAIQKSIAYVKELADSAEQGKRLETAFLRNAAAAGDFGATVAAMGGTLEGLDAKMEQYVRLTRDVGNATGLSAGKVAGYYAQLQAIPGALDKNIAAGDKTGKTMHMLDATIRVARGSHQEFGTVVSTLKNVFNKFGIEGEKSLQFIARMHTASQALRMPLQGIQDSVIGISSKFKMLGDTTQGAIDMMSSMAPKLRAAGLGPEAVTSLVGSYADGIANLDIAQQSFLSQMSGGPGGMRGAFEIELMLKEGRLDEVREKVETVMKKEFGMGQIVSREQAATDERAAQERVKQIQLLTSGPLKMAGSRREAEQLLDAMARGDEGMPEAATPEEALEQVVGQGNEIMERQWDELVVIKNNLQEFPAAVKSLGAYKGAREIIGVEGAIGKGATERRDTATAAAAVQKMVTGEGVTGGAIPEGLYEEMFNNITGTFKDVGASIKETMTEIAANNAALQEAQMAAIRGGPPASPGAAGPGPGPEIERAGPLADFKRQIAEGVGAEGAGEPVTPAAAAAEMATMGGFSPEMTEGAVARGTEAGMLASQGGGAAAATPTDINVSFVCTACTEKYFDAKMNGVVNSIEDRSDAQRGKEPVISRRD